MVAPTSPARRRAFFAALAETGNQTLAAERAKVSRSWVSLHRGTDPAFRAELEAITAAARVRLKAAGAVGPGRGWGSQGGEELTVRGSNGRRVQIARARVRQWTPRVEARFLTALAASCNVKAACAEAGLSQESAYKHRERWPDFAQRWREALEIGFERLEEVLLESAGRPFSEVDYDTDAPLLPGMSVDGALQLLWLHQGRVRGIGGRPGAVSRKPPPTAAEVDDSLSAALMRHARKVEKAAARKAAREARRAPGREG